jgi:DNA-binding SARP family transcriptional activator
MLGPVEVWTEDGPVPAGEPRRLAVLAALLIDVGRVVTTETLIDRVWGDRPPAQAMATLRTYITRIRRVLEEASRGGEPVEVVSQAGGYRLVATDDTIDLVRFRKLVERARRAAGDGERVGPLREALGLWRGDPLLGVDGDWASRTREQLIGERLAATVAWADAELTVGDAAAVVAPLGALAATYPLMEPLVVAQVRALVRLGRPTEALERCRMHRQRLAEEYGTDQGEQLRALYEAILRGEGSPRVDVAVPLAGAFHASASGLAGVSGGVVRATATSAALEGGVGAAVAEAVHASDVEEAGGIAYAEIAGDSVMPAPLRPMRRNRRRRSLFAVAVCAVLLITGVVWLWPSRQRAGGELSASPFTVVEEFSGDALNSTQWAAYEQPRTNGSSWSPSMVRVGGGELQLRGVGKNPTGQGNMSGAVCWCKGGRTGSTPVRTYGVWETKAKFDVGGGYGIMIGLWPNDNSNNYLTLARVDGAARTTMYPELTNSDGKAVLGPPVAGDFTDWNTYSIEWRRDFVAISLNGRVVYDTRNVRSPVIIPATKMFFYAQLVSGPYQSIPGPDQDTPSTVAVHLDWVRYRP